MNEEYTNPYEGKCPVVHAMEVIGSKWKLPIMFHLTQEDGLHYNELKRRVMGITNAMLTRCLRELEKNGLVERRSMGSVPPSVTYHLTEIGAQLMPSLDCLFSWGRAHMDWEMNRPVSQEYSDEVNTRKQKFS